MMVLIYMKINFNKKEHQIFFVTYGTRSAYAAGKYPCLPFPIFPNSQFSSCCCVGSTLKTNSSC